MILSCDVASGTSRFPIDKSEADLGATFEIKTRGKKLSCSEMERPREEEGGADGLGQKRRFETAFYLHVCVPVCACMYVYVYMCVHTCTCPCESSCHGIHVEVRGNWQEWVLFTVRVLGVELRVLSWQQMSSLTLPACKWS